MIELHRSHCKMHIKVDDSSYTFVKWYGYSRSMRVILGRGRVCGQFDASPSQQGSSSWVDNISRSTSNHLLRKSFEPRADHELFMGRDGLSDLVRNASKNHESFKCSGENE